MIKTAHQALYRTYRPQTFEDIVEQEHIVTTLKNAVMANKIAHAYLFCGTRGTGKTTMAKIFSRAVNCLHPNNGNPCNECEICRGIIGGTILDVSEIDAASNNSVDNVRSIIDEVVYTPTRTSKKVYIIDEVHMLSTGAFNALLKTLEEPPEHVIFILATTEPHKLPATVLSRCQRFDFRRITSKGIAQRLLVIAGETGVDLTAEAASFMASLSEGALRDGISILDQCISTGKAPLDLGTIQKIIGIAHSKTIINTVSFLTDRNGKEAITQIDLLFSEGKDPGQYIHRLIQFFRDILVFKTTKSLERLYSTTEEEKKSIQELEKKISMTFGLAIVRELSDLEAAIKWSSSQRILIEMAFLRICSREVQRDDDNISDRIEILEDRIRNMEEEIVTKTTNSPTTKTVKREPAERENSVQKIDKKDNITESNATNKNQPNLFSEWESVLHELKNIGRMKLFSSLLGTSAVWVNDNTIGITLQEEDTFKKLVLSKSENIEAIVDSIKRCTGQQIEVKIVDSRKEEKHTETNVPEKFLNFVEKNGLNLDIIEG